MTNYKKLSSEEKRTYWQKHIEAWRQSGQNQLSYCRNQKIKKSTLGYWQTRLSREKSFVEIPLEIKPPSVIEIIISDKVKIRVKSGYDPDLLIQTVKTLEQLS